MTPGTRLRHGASASGARRRAAPASRRTFSGPGDELAYCCDKASHFLLWVDRRGLARRYIARMRRLLRRLPNHEAIVIATAKALIAEFDRDLSSGGIWRRLEAERIARLYRGLKSRVRIESVTSRFEPRFRIKAVRDACRRVLRLYGGSAPPRDADLVSKAIKAIKWIEL